MAEYGTTLEEKLRDFEMTVLFKHPEKRQATVVGIVGMGGIGKTTLAKEFFKRRRSDYARSSFLLNVRENADTGNLTSLQSKLINDLQGNIHTKIGSVEEGKGILGHYLKYCHALIVLDDVDGVYLLDTLLAMKNVLDPKSLILVTTRDRHVLTRSGIAESSIYMLSGINQEGSREIFCSYAFSLPYPPPGFEPLVEEISNGCEGVPLLLKAFGGLLCGENDLSAWKTVLWRISKMEHKDTFDMLMICYDYLVEEEQQIFLDIAYFSAGKDRDTWIGMWDESG